MTKFTVKHLCGHESTHAFSGDAGQVRQRKEWLERRPCQACWHANESGAASDKNRQLNLPALEGSDQDKAWAEVIRLKAVTHNRDYHHRLTAGPRISKEDEKMRATIVANADNALHELENQRSAAWWVEHRFDALTYIKSRVVDAISPILETKLE